MREVARRAGVSLATVSRVLNNTQDISEETRARVLGHHRWLFPVEPEKQARYRSSQARDSEDRSKLTPTNPRASSITGYRFGISGSDE
jgi:transcriptional regulator with XRE-family HTH domain